MSKKAPVNQMAAKTLSNPQDDVTPETLNNAGC
ncbi:hypothetical protein Pvag_2490 [Pantoea vagans C9-1]|jgi:hypothetical protein|nr:hypothetical protein Pvag_2490 [Pantoea vagans C9-1]